VDASFAKHATRTGSAVFRFGVGAGAVANRQVYADGEDEGESLERPQRRDTHEVEQYGIVTVAALGYQFLSAGGLGINASLAGSRGHIDDTRVSGDICPVDRRGKERCAMGSSGKMTIFESIG